MQANSRCLNHNNFQLPLKIFKQLDKREENYKTLNIFVAKRAYKVKLKTFPINRKKTSGHKH